MLEWLKKKRQAISAGGSVILHSSSEGPKLGITDADTEAYAELRHQVYQSTFGPCDKVSHELIPRIPHIDVFIHPPCPALERDFYTLVTGGMSDVQMSLERGVDASARVELVFYCQEPREEYIQMLRWLAHFPHDYRTWVGGMHTLLYGGDPPDEIPGTNGLNSFVLLPPILQSDVELPDALVLDGDHVELLWVVPLTSAECDLKLQQGTEALLNLLDQNDHPFVFDPNRKSYV